MIREPDIARVSRHDGVDDQCRVPLSVFLSFPAVASRHASMPSCDPLRSARYTCVKLCRFTAQPDTCAKK